MVTTPKSWTKPEDDILTKLWLEGIDARLIASHGTLSKNGRTRMSVISRAHRLKLPPHSSQRVLAKAPQLVDASEAKTAAPRQTTREKIEQSIDLFPTIEVEADEPVRGTIASVMALKSNQCRFPIGDTRHPDFHFCAKTKIPGNTPYCPECAAKAYQKPAPQRRKDPSIEPLVTKEKTLA
jgi:GcrA cell cycle regulator